MEYGCVSLAEPESRKWNLTVETISAASELYPECLASWGDAMERPGNPAFYTYYKIRNNKKMGQQL
jgi:hypothetical protein